MRKGTLTWAMKPPPRQKGRPANATFPLDQRHPLYGVYEQRAKSKFPVLIFAGPAPPKQPPGLADDRLATPAWMRRANAFAAFILTTYREWDAVTGEPGFPLTHAELTRWIAQLNDEARPPPLGGDPLDAPGELPREFRRQRARGRLFIIKNQSHGLAVDTAAKKMSTLWRLRCRDMWTEEERERDRNEGKKKDREGDEARRKIDDLRAALEARQFDPRAVTNAFAAEEFMQHNCGVLEVLMNPPARAAVHSDDDADRAKAAKGGSGEVPQGSAFLPLTDEEGQRVLQSIKQQRKVAPPPQGNADDSTAGHREALRAALSGAQLPRDWVPPGFEKISEDEFETLSKAWLDANRLFQDNLGPRPGPEVLTPAQRAAGCLIVSDLVRIKWCELHGKPLRRDYVKEIKNQIILQLGAGGTGKSVFWGALNRVMAAYGLGLAYGTAYMGVAAAPLGGATLCSTLGLNGTDASKDTFNATCSPETIDAFVNYVGAASVADMRERLKVLFIDEVSQNGPIFVGHVDHTLRLIMDCDAQFGGLIVIWSGDFLLQKQPAVPK